MEVFAISLPATACFDVDIQVVGNGMIGGQHAHA